MLDADTYVQRDRFRYMGLTGFSEYHASQVELSQLLGAVNIYKVPKFSMDTEITTFSGKKSVYQYIEEKYTHVIELFCRDDILADIVTLKSAIGVLYNYWVLRSVCEMYSVDYTETINDEIFLKYISTQLFCTLNGIMHGWFNEKKIELSISIYANIVFLLITEYKLV